MTNQRLCLAAAQIKWQSYIWTFTADFLHVSQTEFNWKNFMTNQRLCLAAAEIKWQSYFHRWHSIQIKGDYLHISLNRIKLQIWQDSDLNQMSKPSYEREKRKQRFQWRTASNKVPTHIPNKDCSGEMQGTKWRPTHAPSPMKWSHPRVRNKEMRRRITEPLMTGNRIFSQKSVSSCLNRIG